MFSFQKIVIHRKRLALSNVHNSYLRDSWNQEDVAVVGLAGLLRHTEGVERVHYFDY